MRANSGISRIIGLIVAIAIIAVAIWAFSQPPEPTNYSVDYDSKAGSVVLVSEVELPTGDLTVSVLYEDEDSFSHLVVSGLSVTLNPDGKTLRFDDSSLINLQNRQYKIELFADTHYKASFVFNVTDHENTLIENIGMAAVIILLVFSVIVAFIRRANRGHW